MKNLLITIITFISCITAERMVFQTIPDDKLYNYFPLKCNYLVFNVKAASDVHITFTETYSQLGSFYEIVIGGWNNQRSVIRKDKLENIVVDVSKAVLKPHIFQKFWVRLNDTEGTISVGKVGEGTLMHFKDPSYFKMTFFGIATGSGVNGEWHIDDGYLTCDLIGCNLGVFDLSSKATFSTHFKSLD